MKKALCFLLVVLLLFPGWVLAAEETGETLQADQEDEVTVQMRVPSSGQVLVNPYCYPVRTSYGTTDEQIISSIQYLVSRSSVPISVSVEVEGAHSDPDAEFVTGDPDPTAKELFIYAEFQPVEDGEDPVWIGSYTGADCQVLINESKADAVVIPSGEDTPGTVAFRLFGAVSIEPDKGWTSDDALSVKMSYKFVPVEEAETTETPEEENPEGLPEEEETAEVSEESGTVTEEPGQETTQEPEQSGETETGTETETPADDDQAAPVETAEDDEKEQTTRTEDEVRPAGFSRVESDRITSREDDEEDKDREEESDGIPWLDLSKVRKDPVQEDRDEPGEEPGPEASNSSGGGWLSVEDGAGEAETPRADDEPKTEEEAPDGDDSGISWLTLG